MTGEQMHQCKDDLLSKHEVAYAAPGHHVSAAIYIVGARLLSVIYECVRELDATCDTLKNVNASLDNINATLIAAAPDLLRQRDELVGKMTLILEYAEKLCGSPSVADRVWTPQQIVSHAREALAAVEGK